MAAIYKPKMVAPMPTNATFPVLQPNYINAQKIFVPKVIICG